MADRMGKCFVLIDISITETVKHFFPSVNCSLFWINLLKTWTINSQPYEEGLLVKCFQFQRVLTLRMLSKCTNCEVSLYRILYCRQTPKKFLILCRRLQAPNNFLMYMFQS